MTSAAASQHGLRTGHREWPVRAERYVMLLSVLAGVVALAVIVGWYVQAPELVKFGSEMGAMRINTAVGVLLLAASLVRAAPWRAALAGLALLLMTIILVQYPTGVGLGIDELLVDDWVDPPVDHPGRVTVNGALSIALLAVGVLTARWRRWVAELVTVLPIAVAVIAIYGYAFGTVQLYRFFELRPMAVHTAALLVVVGCAVWLSIPHSAAQWVAFGNDWGARLQRALVPVGIIILPAVAWLFQQGAENGTYNSTLAFTLLVSMVALVVTLIGFLLGREAREFDTEQQLLVEELFRLNEQLEDRVRVRSVQINRQRTRLALLEERDRIARDLHDRVIQRIFAAGPAGRRARTYGAQVRGWSTAPRACSERASTAWPRSSTWPSASCATRSSSSPASTTTRTSSRCCRTSRSRASRILGFMPTVEAEGSIGGLPPDLVAQVASVIQEALSNIARHARASSARVLLTGTDNDLTLTVSDDGIGLPDPLPRSSGISNLMNRARNLGGTATWTPNEPKGTVLTWRVPRRPGEELDPVPASADAPR